MDGIRLWIYLGTLLCKAYKINIIVSFAAFDVNALNLIPDIIFFRDDLCMAPVIANAALYWTDTSLLERDSLRD